MSNSTESDTAPSDLPHVVLVDGNDTERSELAEQVRAEEYRVTEADGGRKALDILSADSVDLVLTEILLADIGGWDLLDKVKEAFPYVHGVVMTRSITDHGETILKSHQADGYLIKPVQQRPLQILLRALLSPGNLDRPAGVVAVDTDAAVLQTIDAVLGQRGIFVTPFTSVRKAMQHIWHEPPDLLLTEVTVGAESGFDLCEEIRSTRKLPPIPIILVSDDASPTTVGRAINQRVNGFLAKPLQSEILAERVLRLLRHVRLNPDIQAPPH
jgi:CheY-like chemotaxis protein